MRLSYLRAVHRGAIDLQRALGALAPGEFPGTFQAQARKAIALRRILKHRRGEVEPCDHDDPHGDLHDRDENGERRRCLAWSGAIQITSAPISGSRMRRFVSISGPP